MLLRDGRPDIDAVDEGVLDPRGLNDASSDPLRPVGDTIEVVPGPPAGSG